MATPGTSDRTAPDAADDDGTAAEQPVKRSPVSAGDLLAGRYRLLQALPGAAGGSAVLWKAVDEVLARPVAVTVLAARTRHGVARPFLDAAARTGPVLAPGLARTYDAAFEERTGRDGVPRIVAAYVISEWVEGRPLNEVLAEDGPFPPGDAVGLVEQAAEALEAVHAAGLVHGRVTPGNLLLADDGRLRTTGTALAAVTHGEQPPEGREGVEADTRALAEVLYALLTGTWPGAADRAGGLPPPPATTGRLMSPRQVRAGVPRALDLVVLAWLDPLRAPSVSRAATPRALAEAARATVHREPEVVRVPLRRRLPTVPRRVRRAAPWALSLALLVAVGSVGYGLGTSIGTYDAEEDPLEAIVSTASSPSPGAPASPEVDLTRAAVEDYDPSGDGEEQGGEVANAYDGDAATAWRTDAYRTATFGGLKPGVGLLVDLKTSTTLRRVDVDASAGARFELRAAERLGDDAGALAVVASGSGEQVQLTPRPGAKARYWLLWITELPRDGDSFRVGIEEMRFLRS